MASSSRHSLLARFIASPYFQNYGMVFILVLLCAVVAAATWEPWDFYSGTKGGRQAAERAAEEGATGRVLLLATAQEQNAAEYEQAFESFKDEVKRRGLAIEVAEARVFTDLTEAPRNLRGMLAAALHEEATPAAFVCFTQAIAQRAGEITGQMAGASGRPGLADIPVITPKMRSRSIFLSYDNIMTVIRQSALVAIMAVGMTMVIITAGIDLSVGSLLALIGVICAMVLKMNYGIPWWGFGLLVWVILMTGGRRTPGLRGMPTWTRRGVIFGISLVLGLLVLFVAGNRILGIHKDGRATAETVIEQVGGAGQVALLVDSSRLDNRRMVEEMRAVFAEHPDITVVGEFEAPSIEHNWPWEHDDKYNRAYDITRQLMEQYPDLAAVVPVDIGTYDGASKKLTESFTDTRVFWPVMSTTGLILFALFMSVFCGAVTGSGTGVLATRFSIPPFIATLAIMLMARSLAITMTGAEAISNLPHDFTWWHNGFIFEEEIGQWLPVPVLLLVIVYFFGWMLMSKTQFGRYVYAIGGNEEATRLSGVKTGAIKVWVYLINGALAGFVAALTASKLAAGDPKTGVLKELDVIASVVVGGTSLLGGEGRVLGTLIGAILIGVVRNALNLLGFPDTLQDFAIGAAILGAVLLDVAKKKL